MTISQFSRGCSHYDIIVRSYINGWYLSWYQWKENVYIYALVVNNMTFSIDNAGGCNTPISENMHVWEKPSGEQGLKYFLYLN